MYSPSAFARGKSAGLDAPTQSNPSSILFLPVIADYFSRVLGSVNSHKSVFVNGNELLIHVPSTKPSRDRRERFAAGAHVFQESGPLLTRLAMRLKPALHKPKPRLDRGVSETVRGQMELQILM